MSGTQFVPGQRWFSTAEPELGLGTVMRITGRTVQIVFTGSGVVRQYAMASAPLARADYRVGETVRVDGEELHVDAVSASDGLLTYHCGGRDCPEGCLDAEQPVSQADSRLMSGRLDRNAQFEFRCELLERHAMARRHPGWGVLAARIDVIPHQLRVAEIAAERRPPRLLLADEVGLGKTIEAGLVIAQQLACGRAQRVLVLVPDSLVHQWFVELLRRFNLGFAIFDEERCQATSAEQPDRNPFEEAQCVIAATGWLAHAPQARRDQLLAAGWDLLVVDEAHHLNWSPAAASAEYRLAETLAAHTPAVILLTATPQQLGLEGHFARLRLLDPARYHDLEAFRGESAHFVALSGTVQKLLEGARLDSGDQQTLRDMLGAHPGLARLLAEGGAADPLLALRVVDALVDRHGPGRVMIRNRRAVVGGFPPRIRHLHRIVPAQADPRLAGVLMAEFQADTLQAGVSEPEHDYRQDPRLEWLLGHLEALAPHKTLLLCRSRAKVQALEDALRTRSQVPTARFHEGMSLLQRDRNAAWFAQADGARLLIASEVGAEGRNFQFAQHLVLWDLPLDPDLLEQRIGRLDRIGQRGEVHIHLPVVAGSPQEVLLRWYDEGLDAFHEVAADAGELLRRFSARLLALTSDYGPGEARERQLLELLAQTRRDHAELKTIIASGRDQLLELASRRGIEQSLLRDALARDDRAAATDDFAWRLLEQFGVQSEPLGDEVVVLDPEHLTLDAFEEFKSGPRQATLDRATALARDDLLYLRDDHPMLRSATELLLSSENGNATCLIDDGLPRRSVLLETVHVLECVADQRLHVDRYLPPLPIRSIVDTRLADRSDFLPGARALQRAGERPIDLTRQRKIVATLVPPMLAAARERAERDAEVEIERATDEARNLLSEEIERLEALARVNPAVRAEEVAALRDELAALLVALPKARLRLDALRLIASPDFLALRG